MHLTPYNLICGCAIFALNTALLLGQESSPSSVHDDLIASRQLSEILREFSQITDLASRTARIDALESLIHNQPNTSAALGASLIYATDLLALNDQEAWEQAKEIFEQVRDRYPDSWYAELATFGLIGTYHANGQHEDVIAIVENDLAPSAYARLDLDSDPNLQAVRKVLPISSSLAKMGTRLALSEAYKNSGIQSEVPTWLSPPSKLRTQQQQSTGSGTEKTNKPLESPSIPEHSASQAAEPTRHPEEPESQKPNTLLYVLLGLLVVAIVAVVLRKARET